ncbi:Phosphotransferase enzyme family protein [Actinopolymorpha cephalotaxi]|uniref:AcrR family transcriptional regulator n=1 Tax=Actinopolymorpha cephalotaxi TaxID=504797 RepID=A0A1I2WNY0_9ACTN|nr:phosphotransferase [Actinopolymorpha cephalotaxi]NYH85056.1 AcrR family transcriptional regulator [Actinopolymorpha cephalotaxi]SFH03004.1 Phosphotransferase enzyme family protein [Actinopolymorpha cephalotaxi]
MNHRGEGRPPDEPPQLPRFGPIRQVPPDGVLRAMPGASSGTRWRTDRFGGDEDHYPNGGIWQFTARPPASEPTSEPAADASFSTMVKRTGVNHLGTDPVWRGRPDPADPQWWGREAAFYESDLATSGWAPGVRAAHCYAVDDHDGCRDVWLETVNVPATLDVCERAVAGLARWQVATASARHSWLSEDWIPTHVRRRDLDNARTLAHPAWPSAIERGLDPALRDVVADRITDPARIRQLLKGFPRVLTHYDFHNANLGLVADKVAIIDWAYVGWGPIGHDTGHLAADVAGRELPPDKVWEVLLSAYCDALTEAGWTGDPAVVRRATTTSNVLRLGWQIDHVLSIVEDLRDDAIPAVNARLRLFAELQASPEMMR